MTISLQEKKKKVAGIQPPLKIPIRPEAEFVGPTLERPVTQLNDAGRAAVNATTSTSAD